MNKLFYSKSEADKVIAELKAREDVLCTDNRNLLDKVKNLENQLRETAEHFHRNEAQIIENADKVIAELNEKVSEERSAKVDYKISANDLSNGLAEAYDEIRMLRRALWLARAERAKEMCKRLLIQGFDPKWEEAERKCRAKAEQYK